MALSLAFGLLQRLNAVEKGRVEWLQKVVHFFRLWSISSLHIFILTRLERRLGAHGLSSPGYWRWCLRRLHEHRPCWSTVQNFWIYRNLKWIMRSLGLVARMNVRDCLRWNFWRGKRYNSVLAVLLGLCFFHLFFEFALLAKSYS